MSQRRAIAVLAGITFLALLLRLVDFQGFAGGDDSTYIYDAHLLAKGHFLPNSTQWDVRIGIIGPIALAIRLFGLHDWSVALYPLALSLLSLSLIYSWGRQLFCAKVGLLAALLLACFPQDIYYATLVYPDAPGAFYGALAILLAYQSHSARSSRRLLLAGGCGIALLVGYLTRETDLVFVPLCLVALAMHKAHDTRQRLFLVVATVICGIAIESLVYWRLTGNIFFRLAAIHHHTSLLHGISPLHFLLQWPLVLFNPGYPQIYFYAILTVWAVLMLRWRRVQSQERLLLVWLFGVLIVFTFAVLSLRPLVPLLEVEPRYLSDVAYPAILLIARAVYATYPARLPARVMSR